MADNSPKAVVLRMLEAYNDHTPDVYITERFYDYYSDDFVFESTATSQSPARRFVGKQSNRELLAQISGQLRDSHQEAHDVISEGDRVAVRFTWTGIVRATEQKVRMDAVDFFTVRDGLIQEVMDTAGPILPVEGDAAREQTNG